MTYVLILVSVIAFVELLRLYYLFRPTPRSIRSHFKGKVKAIREMRWDLEFKVFKAREIREQVRDQYDGQSNMKFHITKQLEAMDKNAKEREGLEKQLPTIEDNMKRFESQMRMIDTEIEGAAPTEDNPNGQVGIMEQIASLRELETMTEDYIKTL